MATSLALTQPPQFLKVLAHDLRWRMIVALARSDMRVQELVTLLKQPPNLVSYHLKQLRALKLVTERRSAADGRDVYYSLALVSHQISFVRQYDLSELQRSLTRSMQG